MATSDAAQWSAAIGSYFKEHDNCTRPRGSDRWNIAGGQSHWVTDERLQIRRRSGTVSVVPSGEHAMCAILPAPQTTYTFFKYTKFQHDLKDSGVTLYHITGLSAAAVGAQPEWNKARQLPLGCEDGLLKFTKELCTRISPDGTIRPECLAKALIAGGTVSKVVRKLAKLVLGR